MPRVVSPDRSLVSFYPDLVNGWSPRNQQAPCVYAPSSHFRAWWRCIRGYEWQARIDGRVAGNGCPFCSGRLASVDHNLAVLYPDLAASLVEPQLAYKLTPGSHARPWWRCARNHQWQAVVKSRVRGGHGCPYCAGQRPTIEHNLAVLHPVLVREWSSRNAMPAAAFSPMSHAKTWWICSHGHEWRSTISKRAMGKGCPYCSGRLPTPQRNLAILYPEIAQTWAPRNEKSANMYTPMSNAKVWWVCAQSHQWQWLPDLPAQPESICAGSSTCQISQRLAEPVADQVYLRHPGLAVA